VTLAVAALLALAAMGGPSAAPRAALAGDEEPSAPADRCPNGFACYHFLRAPVAAPDPCPCPRCTPEHPHAGDDVPEGWSGDCWNRRSLACFLKRHAASWRLSCSECLADKDCCKPLGDRCPMCDDPKGAGPWRKDAEKTVAERLEVEKRHWDKGTPVVVVGRHFYAVTDVRIAKVVTPHDGERAVSGHEYAHILVMRAEAARRDFEKAFGMPGTPGQTALFVPEKDTTGRKIRADYFRNPEVPFIYSAYGSASESAISEGFCMNGLCIPLQKVGDDRGLHEALRQFLGQIYFTTWVVTNGELKTTPPWAFAGIGFWLGKEPPALQDEIYWLEGEDNTISGSGKAWKRDVADAARRKNLRPIEEILAATTLAKLSYRDFQQVWGWFDVALEDVPKEWAATLGEIRRGTEVHAAFKKGLGWTPEEFQVRFQERLAGLRKTLKEGPSAPAAQPVLLEKDPEKIAARIRGAGVPKDAATVRELLDLCGREGDLVRETAIVGLARTKDPAAREALWAHGAVHADSKVRASALRVIRLVKAVEAKTAVRAALADPVWYVRAEALLAAAAIRDFDSQAAMREALVASEPKLRIAACDAVRTLGAEANATTLAAVRGSVEHDAWQVRVAAADALAAAGPAATMEAVDAMVSRLSTETARVADAFRDALIAITGEDLGSRPANWLEWWKRERPRAAERGGFLPPTKPPKKDGRYAEDPPPTYHGVELWSARIGFVLDVSKSTDRAFQPPEELAPRLLGGKPTGTIQTACQGEIAATLRSLDSRTQIAMWVFSDAVLKWNAGALVPATPGNVDSAIGFVRGRSPAGETNFHAALRAALGYDETDPWATRLPGGPDTVTFLTDGSPTVGEITEPEVVLNWATELNRYARVKLHTVAMGALGVDEPLLERLATRNGGVFRQVRESHPK
jgi:hypothetical protein